VKIENQKSVIYKCNNKAVSIKTKPLLFPPKNYEHSFVIHIYQYFLSRHCNPISQSTLDNHLTFHFCFFQLEVFFGTKCYISKPAIIGTIPIQDASFQPSMVPSAPEMPALGPESLNIELPPLGASHGNMQPPSYEECTLLFVVEQGCIKLNTYNIICLSIVTNVVWLFTIKSTKKKVQESTDYISCKLCFK